MGINPVDIHRFVTDMLNDPLYFSGAYNYLGLDAFREDRYGSKKCWCPCGKQNILVLEKNVGLLMNHI